MSALPKQLTDAIDQYIDEKINAVIAAKKLDITAEATSIDEFQAQMMQDYDGNEVITQGFFRGFLDWLSRYYSYNLTLDEKLALAACRYITPVDVTGTPDVGKIIAPVASLVLTGEGVRPTVPDPADTTPDDAGFNPETHLMSGGFAYNVTDNLWYYRGGDTIHELKEALNLGVADISDFNTAIADALSGYVQAVAGKGLSTNDLTNTLKANYETAYLHSSDVDKHLVPDGTTIRKSAANKLEAVALGIIAMFSGTAPIVKGTDGALSISINTDQFEITPDGKLQIKAAILGAEGAKLSFNTTTNILSIDASGANSVDLTSLAAGGVDLSDYVKKTGESSQTIQGEIKATGEISAFSS